MTTELMIDRIKPMIDTVRLAKFDQVADENPMPTSARLLLSSNREGD